MATDLVLIRHGHAVRVNGDYINAPLTRLGESQAALTGLYLCQSELRLDGLYSSPLRRAKETAALIGSEISRVPAIRPGLQELEGAEVPQLVLFEVLARFNFFGRYLYENVGKPLRWPIVGRVSRVLVELIQKHPDQRIGVVSHSGVISSVLAWFYPSKRYHWWRYTVSNCSLTLLRVEGARAELVFVNDTQHLSAETTTTQPPAATVQTAKQAEQKVEQTLPATPTGPQPPPT